MKQYIAEYTKWACMALVAGFIIAGTPGHSQAAFQFTANPLADLESALGLAAVGVCGDYKGGECSEKGAVQKCKSKNGDKLCQTCDSYPHCPKGVTYCWGSGSKGDCWDKQTAVSDHIASDTGDKAVLDRF
jgi:hypothetical protein